MKEARKAVGRFLRTADMFLLFVSLLAASYGMVLISSATAAGGQSKRQLLVQGGAILIGVVLFVLLSLVEVEVVAGFWKWILAFNVLFMCLLLVWGGEKASNRSWLEPKFLPFSIQPAELVKIGFILLLAKQMYELSQRERLNHILSIGMLGFHFAGMAGLIFYTSKDSGMIVAYACIFFAMCLGAGIHFRWFAAAGALLAGAAPLIWNSLQDYQRQRILVGFRPELDPLDYGYQSLQSKTAIGSGRLFGQGLYQGNHTQLGKIPVKESDFIFSVAGEELGLVGCLAILLLLGIIVVRCLYIATRAKTELSASVCVGVAGMILFQTIINVGMCLALTPVVGLTLPFFSYGGSSIVAVFAAMGLVSSVRRNPKHHWLKD
ncbi:MAG: FtsW/RodA/SpoVE family cell cycle protein [Oscillospiraceae bacterium]|nr:FtsW/RodA/SpoVE family cell cycle protein [Oscillospiraceae bacterium]